MNTLEMKRKVLLEKLSKYSYFVKGSLASVCMVCSRVNCVCTYPKGAVAHRLTYKGKNQKTRTVYVPNGRVKEVRKLISNYRMYRDITEMIFELNVRIFKESSRN